MSFWILWHRLVFIHNGTANIADFLGRTCKHAVGLFDDFIRSLRMLTYMRAHCTGITGPIVRTGYITYIANAIVPSVNARESAHRAHTLVIPFVVSTYLVADIAIAVRPWGMVTYKIALVTNAVDPVMLTTSTAYGAHMIVISGMIGAYKLAICANGIIPDVTRTYGVAAILAYAVHPVMGIGDDCTFLLHRY